MPQDKEHIITEKYSENPTQCVLKTWYERDGRNASVKALLLALKDCKQGSLAHEIEMDLNIKLLDKVQKNTMGGTREARIRKSKIGK